MESNCRKLVSACVQLGKRNHLPPGPGAQRPRCRAARCGARSQAGQRRGCAAAGADRLSPVVCVVCPPPPVSPSPGVQPAAVECLFSKEADIKKGELSEAPEGRKEPAGSKLFGRPPPSANGKRRPLRALPRAAPLCAAGAAGGSSAPVRARLRGARAPPAARRLRGAALRPGATCAWRCAAAGKGKG